MKKYFALAIVTLLPSFCWAGFFGANSAKTSIECHSEGDGLTVRVSESSGKLMATVTFITKRSFDFPVQRAIPVAGQHSRDYVGIENAIDNFYLSVDGPNSQMTIPELQTDEPVICNSF